MPPFRAEHIGSLLRPKALLDARYASPQLDPKALRALEDEHIARVIRWQESIGLRVDHRRRVPPRVLAAGLRLEGGGLRARRRGRQRRRAARRRRATWRKIGSAPVAVTRKVRARRTDRRRRGRVRPPARDAHGQSHAAGAVLPALPARQTRASIRPSTPTSRRSSTTWWTCTSRSSKRCAAAGGRYVQLDEVAQTVLCDETIRDAVRERGDDPERWSGATSTSSTASRDAAPRA